MSLSVKLALVFPFTLKNSIQSNFRSVLLRNFGVKIVCKYLARKDYLQSDALFFCNAIYILIMTSYTKINFNIRITNHTTYYKLSLMINVRKSLVTVLLLQIHIIVLQID